MPTPRPPADTRSIALLGVARALADHARRRTRRRFLVTLAAMALTAAAGLAIVSARADGRLRDAHAELRGLEVADSVLRVELAAARARAEAAEVARVASTAEARRQIAGYRAALEGLDVDTLVRTDTVRVPVEVLVRADSVIRSCSLALTDCDLAQSTLREANRLLAADTAVKAQRIAATARLIPSRSSRLWHDTKVGVVVGASVYLLSRLRILP